MTAPLHPTDPESLRKRALDALTTARDRTALLTSCVEEPELTAPAALAVDVPTGLGPGTHRQPGGAVAAARGRRAGRDAAR